MYLKFNSSHDKEFSDSNNEPQIPLGLNGSDEVPEFLNKFFAYYGGRSYHRGVFRVHTLASSIEWTEKCQSYFPKYQSRIFNFGFDWLGRQYAADVSGNQFIWMFDPATCEDLQLEQDLEGFFNEDLVDFWEDTLDEEIFRDIIKDEVSLEFNNCFGFKKPLFLGGLDEASNYERIDIDVYWELNMQIFNKL